MAKIRHRAQAPDIPLVTNPPLPADQAVTGEQASDQASTEARRAHVSSLADHFTFDCRGFLDKDLPQLRSMLDLLETRLKETRLSFVSEHIDAAFRAMHTVFGYGACKDDIKRELGGKLVKIVDDWLVAADEALGKGQRGIMEQHFAPIERITPELQGLILDAAGLAMRGALPAKVEAIGLKWLEQAEAADQAVIDQRRTTQRQLADEAFKQAELSLKAREENIRENNHFMAARALPELERKIAELRTNYAEHLSVTRIDGLQTKCEAASKAVTSAIQEHEKKIDEELSKLESSLEAAKHKGQVIAASRAIGSKLLDIERCTQSKQYASLNERYQTAMNAIAKLPDPPKVVDQRTSARSNTAAKATPAAPGFSTIAKELADSITRTHNRFVDLCPKKDTRSPRKKVKLAGDLRKILCDWRTGSKVTLSTKIDIAQQANVNNQDLRRLETVIDTTGKIYAGLIEYLDTMHTRWQTPDERRVLAPDEAQKGAIMATQFQSVITVLRILEKQELKSLEASYTGLQDTLLVLMSTFRGPFAEKSIDMIDQRRARSPARAVTRALEEFFSNHGTLTPASLDSTGVFAMSPTEPNLSSMLRATSTSIPEHYEILRDAVMRTYSRDADLYQTLREAYRGAVTMPETIDISKIEADLALAQGEIRDKFPNDYRRLVELLQAQRDFYKTLEASLGKEECPNIAELKAARDQYERLSRTSPFLLLRMKADIDLVESKSTPTQFLFTYVGALTTQGSFADIHPLYQRVYEIERDISRAPFSVSNNELLSAIPEAVRESGIQVGATDIEALPGHFEPFLVRYDNLIAELEADLDFKSTNAGKTLGILLERARRLCEYNLKQVRDLADIESLTSDQQEQLYSQLDAAHDDLMKINYDRFPEFFRARLQDFVKTPPMQSMTPKLANKNGGLLLMQHTLPAYLKMYFEQSLDNFAYYYSMDGGIDAIVDLRKVTVAKTSSRTTQRASWLVRHVKDFLKVLLEAYDQRGEWNKSDRSKLTRELLEAQLKCFEAQDMLMDLIAPGIREEQSDQPDLIEEIDLRGDQVGVYDNQEEIEALERKRILYSMKYRELRAKPLIPYAIKKYVRELPHIQTCLGLKIEEQIVEELKSKSLDDLISAIEIK